MPFEFKLPDLGEGLTEAEIRKWLVKEGDEIKEHQNALEVETEKAVVEVPSPKAGKVMSINKEEGDVARVGEVLMTIATEGEEAQPTAPPQAPPEEAAPKAEEKPEAKKESVTVMGELPEAEEETVLAAPAVRAMAKEMGIDLRGIKGTGPGGSITREDLLKESKRAEERKKPAPKPEEALKTEEALKPEAVPAREERIPLRGLRKKIAENLMRAQRTIAFTTGMEEADVTELWELREREKGALRERGIHLTFVPFFIKAVQHALKEHPFLNASLDDEKGEIILKRYFNIGIAVDTPEGLMVPVIKDVDGKTIVELAGELQVLAERARERKISLDELRGSTFSITNYGHFGGIFATPIINYPDTGILGTGRIQQKPWVRGGAIEIRKILPLSLTFDHRVTDGVDASKFLMKVVRYLEDPALIFIESA